MSGSVDVEVDGNVGTITLDNPEKRNAISPSMFAGIAEGLSTLEEEVRVVVLTATGEVAFSSGYDMSEFDRDEEDRDTEVIRSTIDGVRDFPYPTVAKVNGDAIGGAFELICACDVRVGVTGARVGLPPAKIGIVYEDVGINHVMDVIGPAYTKELLFTADLVPASRGKEMGLFNYLVERDELESKTYELAETIAGRAPLSLTGMKQIVNAILEKRRFTEAEKRWVAQLRDEARASRDHQEALSAFAEDRSPEFEGR